MRKRDACLTTTADDNMLFVSDHDYSYSMGIGDAWKVSIPVKGHTRLINWNPRLKTNLTWVNDYVRGGTLYNCGIGEPRYPVPATIQNAVTANVWTSTWYIPYGINS